MNSNKRTGEETENNKRQKQINVGTRVDNEKENPIHQERRSCGCVRATSAIINPGSSRAPVRRASGIITQCSVNRNNQIKSTAKIDNKTNNLNRPPLADIKEKSNHNNIKCCTSTKNCNGAVKKMPEPLNTGLKRRSAPAPLAASTVVKRNYSRTSGYSKAPLVKVPSLSSKPSSSIQRNVAAVAPSTSSRRCCCCPQKPTYESKPLNIPPRKQLEKTVNLCRGFDCGSPILDASFHTPIEDNDAWLTFKTNPTDSSQKFPYKEQKSGKSMEEEDSGFGLDTLPTQVIFDGIPSLRKKTLKKQLSISSGYKGVVNLDPHTNKVHPSVLYSDYMIDVIKNIITKEEKLVINKDFIRLSNILPIYRTAVINWLIKLHQFLNSDATVFFLCIRLFDKILMTVEIPQELLQLTGMIIYWIANKYGDTVEYLTIRKLQDISCNLYSARYLMNYERKILNILKYDISVEEPIIFVRYYLYLLQIEESNDMSFCANYLLDCLATSWDINTFVLSLQASGAVFLSLQLLGNTSNIWKKLEAYPGYYSPENLYDINERIIERLLLIQNENYEFREIYQKYACEKYNCVSLRVCDGLNNLK